MRLVTNPLSEFLTGVELRENACTHGRNPTSQLASGGHSERARDMNERLENVVFIGN